MAETPRSSAGGLSGAATPGAAAAAGDRRGAASGADRPGPGAGSAGTRPLGVGGTSEAAAREKGDEPAAAPLAGGKAAAGAALAVPAAGAATQLLMIATFINYLKGLMMAAFALAQNLWHLLVGGLLAIGKNLLGGVLAIGGTISSALGGAVSAVAAGVTTAVAGGVTVALIAVSAVTMIQDGANNALRDGELVNCTTTATKALAKVDGAEGAVDQQTQLNARTVYSVLKAWGAPDENIAGILGNWDAESGIDATSVQDHFGSPHVMTEEKRTAALHTGNGIGLGQWTFGRNSALRDYAAALGKDWWTVEVQLGFMISAGEGSNAEIVKDMLARSLGTPADAALYFHDEWERSADTTEMAQRRAAKANTWMALFSGWTANHALADSILAQSGTTVDNANTGRAASVRSDCRGVGSEGVLAKEGGLTLEEAHMFMETYLNEGEAFLQNRYPGASGPGDCGHGKADNCVGFSVYFLNRYTSVDGYPMANGIGTARALGTMIDRPRTRVPSVYSIASGMPSGSSDPRGHTFVVLGIQGDHAVIGEAQCGSNHLYTRAKLMPLSELTNGAWEFVDVSDLILNET